MIKQLNPQIPLALNPVEIDKAIIDLQYKLETNLSWLTNAYGRAYRFLRLNDEKRVYYPEIYTGIKNGAPQYYRTMPDNLKKGSCFFVVGSELINDFSQNSSNFLKYPVSIIFQVNLAEINKVQLSTEIFTQNLIMEVRNVLTNLMNGTEYRFDLTKIIRDFQEVYKEFSLDELRNFSMAPLDSFRVEGFISLYQDCLPIGNTCSILTQNISENEILNCLLPTLDFQKSSVFNSLTAQQKMDIQTQLGL